MRSLVVVAPVLALALACGERALTPDGGAGAAGAAGTTGDAGAPGTGTAGTGGSGGLPLCNLSGQGDVVEFAIVGSDGNAVSAPASAAVTVAAVETCAVGACSSPTNTATRISDSAQRIFLTAVGPQAWTLYLRDSAMPLDFLKVGDTFDMTVDAGVDSTFYQSVNQTMVLARNGQVIVFAAGLDRFGQPPLPDLQRFGFAFTDAGAYCQNSPSSIGCVDRPHTARVAAGTDAFILVGGGQTQAIGGLSITVGWFSEEFDPGSCDAKSSTVMAGFRLP
jgi:hypothetical protein